MDEVIGGDEEAYRRGDMAVVNHWRTFAGVMRLIKFGSLALAVALSFLIIWLCTPTSFLPALAIAAIVAVAGGVFLSRGGGH